MAKRKPTIIYATGIAVVILALFVMGTGEKASAQNLSLINFTGKITNTDGTEIADGVYDFRFRLYDAPTGGSLVWTETLDAATTFSATIATATELASSIEYAYSGATATSTLRVGQYLSSGTSSAGALIVDYDTAANTVTVASSSPLWTAGSAIGNRPYVEGGVIDVNLGAVTSLASIDFSDQLYLEITFSGEVMQPRKILASVPYALESARLGGKSEAELAGLAEDETISGEWTFNNIVDISSSSSDTVLTITQNGSGNIMEVKRGATTSFAVLNNGQVQIGDYVFPASYAGSAAGYVLKTDAAGNMYWDADIAGSGGGSGFWASSTNNQFIYQADAGQLVVVGNNATSSLGDFQLQVTGSSLFDDISLRAQNGLRLYDSSSNYYTAIRASSSLSGNLILTLPDSVGSPNQALLTDGNGNLSWGSPTGFTYVNPGVAGQMAYYAADGSQLSGTSSLYMSTSGYVGIATTTVSSLLTVGPVAGSQFLVNASGQVIGGEWLGDAVGLQYGGTGANLNGQSGFIFSNGTAAIASSVIATAYGGTGRTAWQGGSLVMATTTNVIDELLIGGNGDILQVTSGRPTWVSTSSLGIDFNAIGGTLDPGVGGTGADSSGWNGMVRVVGGAWGAVTGTTDYVAYWLDNNTVGAEEFLATSRGGTGRGDWVQYGLVYASTTTELAELPIGSNGFLLAVNGTGDGYTWIDNTTVGIDTTLSAEEVEDFAGALVASTTGTHTLISIAYNDSNSSMNFIINPDLSLYNNSTSSFITLSGLSSTATGLTYTNTTGVFSLSAGYEVPLIASTTNWNNNFNTVTASSPNWNTAYNTITASSSFWDSAYGTVTASSSYWDTVYLWGNHAAAGYFATGSGHILDVAHGGTGLTAWSQGSIAFATSADLIAELIIGTDGTILQSVGGRPTWVSTSSLGIDFNGIGGLLDPSAGGTGADSSGWNGMVRVVGGSWGVVNGTGGYAAYWTDNNTVGAEQFLDESRGGTGRGSWTQYALVFASTSTYLDEIAIGAADRLLSVNAAGDGYIWVDASTVGVDTTLSAEEVEDYAGNLMASTTGTHSLISITYSDSDSSMDFVVNPDLSQFSNATSAFITLLDLYSTSSALTYNNLNGEFSITTGYEIPLSASTSNWNTAFNWGNHAAFGYFSTSSGSALDIAYGGLGTSTAPTYGQLLMGRVGGWYDLVSTSSLGLLSPLDIDSVVQRYDADLNALAGLTASTDYFIVGNAGNWDTRSSTTVYSILNLGTIATQNAGSVNITGGSITGITDLAVADGGTGRTNWNQYGIVFATTTGELSNIEIGAADQVFTVNATGDGYLWVDSSAISGDTTLSAEEVEDFAGALIASTTGTHSLISVTYNDSNSSMDFIVTPDLSLFNNSTSSFITLTNLSSLATGLTYTNTTGVFSLTAGYEIPLAASSSNWNYAYNTIIASSSGWNSAFDIITASSSLWDEAYSWNDHSLAGYFSTSSGHVLDVAHGGTGITTISAESLLYASGGDTIAEFPIGNEGQVLVVNGGQLAWASTSPAAQHNLLSVTHGDVQATSTLIRGDLVVVDSSGKWNRLGIGANGYILYADANGDAVWATTTMITSVGTITVGSWEGEVIDVAYGGTGASNATSARENLDLDEVYKFGINATGTNGDVWFSDGDGRGYWAPTSSLGVSGGGGINVSVFVGTTTVTTNGSISTSTLVGYEAANNICDYEYAGSHFCRTYDILVSVELGDITSWGDGSSDSWIAEGPPGFTDNSNDCDGWTSADIDFLGAFWVYNSAGGGAGYLVNCTQAKPLACCSRQ